MTAAATGPALDLEALPQRSRAEGPRRLASVDALRGFVMFAMLFVNDVAGVRAAPAWMKHISPSNANGMTFVDLVFPAFLFIVGLSIPIALARRIERGEPIWRILVHVIVRSASLILLGVFMVNTSASTKQMGWPAGLWPLLVYVFAIVAFVTPAKSPAAARHLVNALRVLAFAGFVLLWWVYRDDKGRGMRTQWWGILGLIGWAYLVASAIYLLFRRERAALVGAVALLLLLYIADKRGRFDAWFISDWINIGGTLGSQPSITLAGAVLGAVLLDGTMTFAHKLRWSAIYGVFLAIAAILLHRLYGINKNAATPSWCLWASAITAWLWIVFALLCIVAQPPSAVMRSTSEPNTAVGGCATTSILNFFTRGGENVLLAYLLMPVWYHGLHLFGWNFYDRLASQPALIGIGRSLVAATVCLYLSILLKERCGVRLRL